MTEDPIYIVLQSKSMDCFLYDRDLSHERFKVTFGKLVKYTLATHSFKYNIASIFELLLFCRLLLESLVESLAKYEIQGIYWSYCAR